MYVSWESWLHEAKHRVTLLVEGLLNSLAFAAGVFLRNADAGQG